MPNTDTTTEDYVIIMTEDGPRMILKSNLPSESMMMDTTTSVFGDAGRGREIPQELRANGGRIGFSEGMDEARQLLLAKKYTELLREYSEAGLTDADSRAMKEANEFVRDIKMADGGRIGFKKGSPEEPSEVGIMAIDVEAGDDDEEDMMMAGITFSRPEKSYLFRKLGGAGGADRSFTMPQLYRILNNPNRYPDDAAVLKEIAIMGLGGGRKDGGRIKLESGTPSGGLGLLGRAMAPEQESKYITRKSDTDETDTINRIYEEQGGDGLSAYLDRNPDLKYKYVFDIDDGELSIMPNKLHPDFMNMENIIMLKSGDGGNIIDMSNMFEEKKAKGGRIGLKGGSGSSNRVAQLILERDYLLSKDEDVSYIDAELESLGYKMKSEGGVMDVKMPTGKIRKNNAGVVERDYRDEGGFVPVGIKERADDVPAMLSKNEFVMTADAVRGIGNGSVEEGSKKLYNTMKQAEKVGKA